MSTDPNKEAFALAVKAFLDPAKLYPDLRKGFAIAHEIAHGSNYEVFVITGWLVPSLSLRTIDSHAGA
jgi:hypothetical protein